MKPPGVGLLKQSSPILRGVMFKQMWKQQQASVLISYVLPYSVHRKKTSTFLFDVFYYNLHFSSVVYRMWMNTLLQTLCSGKLLSIKQCQISKFTRVFAFPTHEDWIVSCRLYSRLKKRFWMKSYYATTWNPIYWLHC